MNLHKRKYLPSGSNVAEKVEFEGFLPRFIVKGVKGSCRRPPRVIYKNRNGTELFCRRTYQIFNLLSFGYVTYCVIGSYASVIKANADQVTPYLLFPMSYIYMIIPIAVSFMVLFLLLDTAKLLVSLFGRDRFTNSGSR